MSGTLILAITSLLFLIAVYFSFKLSKETKHEKYWIILAVGFFIFAIHHWAMLLLNFSLIQEGTREIIEDISSIIGAILIGYSMQGLYRSMKKIRKKLG